MSDLRRTREGAASERGAAQPHVDTAADRPPPAHGARPRIGRGQRPKRRARRASAMDMGVLLRALGVSLAVAVVVLGGFFLLRALGFEAAQTSLLDPGGTPHKIAGGLVPSLAPAAVSATPAAPPAPSAPAAPPSAGQVAKPADPPPAAPAAQQTAIDAGRIASLLSHEPTANQAPANSPPATPAAGGPTPEQALPARKAPAPPAAAPTAPAPMASAAPAAPTPADFARPAFIEPPTADKADADAIDDPAPETATPTPAARPSAPPERADDNGSGTAGRINSAINLRAAPQKGAAVLATLEAGTKVTVYGCKYWCEVAADGKRGYVYRRAVDQ